MDLEANPFTSAKGDQTGFKALDLALSGSTYLGHELLTLVKESAWVKKYIFC